jgi:hypothetical protein
MTHTAGVSVRAASEPDTVREPVPQPPIGDPRPSAPPQTDPPRSDPPEREPQPGKPPIDEPTPRPDDIDPGHAPHRDPGIER